ncbi:MAG: ABC transporter ATP-binding protein, partial [Hyphomicrobiales bacterium]|nr:ABC transporter ATP-binding protein [Hyphomicrobiales bacterium]
MKGEALSPLLRVRDLSVALPQGADRRFAVEGASFDLAGGEILCVVGESGSGKSVLSSTIMGAAPAGLHVLSGSILFRGNDIVRMGEAKLRRLRGNQIAMVFQEPMAALNPAVKVGEQIEEVFTLHSRLVPRERRQRVRALLADTRLADPDRIAKSYPHQLSGGQCQRVVIAMALAMQPALLIADEPTSALDVTTQAQVLKLMRELRDEHGHAVLFVTHDFGVVAEVADRVAVMQAGRIVEIGDKRDIFEQPRHPYTQALLAAAPIADPRARRDRPVLEGD